MSDSLQTRLVRTPIDEISYNAADAAGMDPDETEVVSVSLDEDDKLVLTLEGPLAAKE